MKSPQGPHLSRPDPQMEYASSTTRVRNPSNQLFSSAQNLPKKLNISSSVTATMSPPVGTPQSNSNASPSQLFDFRYPSDCKNFLHSPGSLVCVMILALLNLCLVFSVFRF